MKDRFGIATIAINLTAALVFTAMGSAQNRAPVVEIAANGFSDTAATTSEAPAFLSLSIDPGDHSDAGADYWLVEILPSGAVNYLDLTAGWSAGLEPTFSGPLVQIDQGPLPPRYLSAPGRYTYVLAVDLNMNGILDMESLAYDLVYVHVTDAYSGDVDPAKIISILSPSGKEVRFPVNQLVLWMEEGTPRARVVEMAGMLGGTVVGQASHMGFYQIEIPATTRGELDASIAIISNEPGVDAAGYNTASRPAAACPAESDLGKLKGGNRCAWAEIEYYPSLTIFEAIKSRINRLSPVKVAVFEWGLDATNPELRHDDIYNLTNPDPNPYDDKTTIPDDSHGTEVAGVIFAADNGKGVNGLASRFLGRELKLLFGQGHYLSNMPATLVNLPLNGVDIVNISLSWEIVDEATLRFQRAFSRFVSSHPEILFVTAAGNESESVDASLSFPSGLQADNFITVGGTANCDPLQPYSSSNTGPGVDIAAPAVAVPLVGTDGNLTFNTGTSFAAPMVTSLAAILKSIDPNLTPKKIKEYITQHSRKTDASVGGKRLSFALPLVELLWDKYSSSGIKDVLVQLPGFSTAPTVPGAIVGNICDSFSVSVEGYGSESRVGTELLEIPIWYDSGAHYSPSDIHSEFGFSLNCDPCTFGLGPIKMTGVYGHMGVMAPPFGSGPGITMLNACRVVQHPHHDAAYWDHDLYWIETQASFSGVMNLTVSLNPNKDEDRGFSGQFDVVTRVKVSPERTAYIETNCEGGIPAYAFSMGR